MTARPDPAEICEHGDIRAACIDCLEASQPYRPKPTGGTTTGARSTRPDRLSGTKDVSVPVYDIDLYMHPGDNDWLIAQGFPHDLRPGGFVYLRQGDALRARTRGVRMEWRAGEDRRWRTGDGAEAGEYAVDGWVFVVAPGTWERVEFPLGNLAESQRSGLGYLIASADGNEVRHLIARDPFQTATGTTA